MSHIYKPEGRAAEYSPSALNLYVGCTHDCEYCFARSLGRRRSRDYIHTDVHLQKITHDSICQTFAKYDGTQEQVLLCFTTDPYMNGFDTAMTTFALEQALQFRVPIAILTKAPSNAIRDYDLMAKFGQSLIMGTTITKIQGWKTVEPGADSPKKRIKALAHAKELGIPTWISMEPAYSLADGLEIIDESHHAVDSYRIGKMNHRKLDVDWEQYVIKVVERLRNLNKSIYVKNDLAALAPLGFLTAEERNPRLQDAKPFVRS